MPIKKPAPDAIKKRDHAQSVPACSPRSKVILGLDNQHGIYRDTPSKPHMTRAWSRGRITVTSKGLQLLRYPRSKPICATRPVSEHGQPHMRSPLIAAAPRSRFRRAGLREDENHSRKRHFRPWLATVRLPGSARTDQVLGDDGITLVYSLGNLHRNAFDNDTGGHVFPERDQ